MGLLATIQYWFPKLVALVSLTDVTLVSQTYKFKLTVESLLSAGLLNTCLSPRFKTSWYCNRNKFQTKNNKGSLFWTTWRFPILTTVHSFERYLKKKFSLCWKKYLLLFREIHFSNFKCIFQHLNWCHKCHSMVQIKDRTFIFHDQ